MKKIGLVAPNEMIAEMAKKEFFKKNISIPIIVARIENVIQKSKKLLNDGVEVFISRGGLSHRIRTELKTPVVEIPVTVENIAVAIYKASKLSNNIALLGYDNLVRDLESFNTLFKGLTLKQVFIESNDELENTLMRLKKEGIGVIIGGVTQCKIAQDLNINSIFLSPTPDVIYNAYQEAEAIYNTLLAEKQRVKEISTILDSSKEGYISINKEGEVTLINRKASEFLGIKQSEILGKYITKIYPKLGSLLEVLSNNKEYWNEIIDLKSVSYVYNRIPINVKGKITGAIATIQDIHSVQVTESKIRTNFFAKGLYAKYTLDDIEGRSKVILQTKRLAEKFAKTDTTILINGETGTGKELFAQGIHNSSKRKNRPFVGVNCASLPESILESELFGYVEGAFTGAKKEGKMGFFELAHEGTLFLDELSEIPLELQGRLLRVLQEKKVMRLGSDEIIPINVRVIASTNRDLATSVANGTFRQDLFFRINVIALNLPSLHQRGEDIFILSEKFFKVLAHYKKIVFSESSKHLMRKYRWPGNVRELRNLIERLSITSPNGDYIIKYNEVKEILKENEPLFMYNKSKKTKKIDKKNISKTNEDIKNIREAIKLADNNKTQAAKLLGVHRSTLWRWLKEDQIK